MTETERAPRRAKNENYAIAFRKEAVRLVESDLSQREVIQRLGINHASLQAWLKQYGTAVYSQMRRTDLHQALTARTQPQHPLIHHSDRGLQYAAREYVGLLESHGVALSMTPRTATRTKTPWPSGATASSKTNSDWATRYPTLPRPTR